MVRKIAILTPLLLATMALALVVGLWPSGQADASGHSATRSFFSASVAPGDEITVSIAATNDGVFGQVVETLPDGFAYVADSSPSDIRTTVEGQEVKFSFLGGNSSFSYKVTASDTAGEYMFVGMLVNDTGSSVPVVGDSVVTVTGTSGTTPTTPVPSNPEATRSLPTASVGPGDEITVSIAVTNYGAFGQVVETLPDGFSYVADSTSPSDIRIKVVGQEVTFTLLGEETFSYKVMASRTGDSHTFMGILKDDQGVQYPIGGISMVTVDARCSPLPECCRLG